MNELKPCPFCGTAPKDATLKEGSYGYYSPRYYVECKPCGYHLKGFDTEAWEQGRGHFDVPTAKADAIKVWNTRATDQQTVTLNSAAALEKPPQYR